MVEGAPDRANDSTAAQGQDYGDSVNNDKHTEPALS